MSVCLPDRGSYLIHLGYDLDIGIFRNSSIDQLTLMWAKSENHFSNSTAMFHGGVIPQRLFEVSIFWLPGQSSSHHSLPSFRLLGNINKNSRLLLNTCGCVETPVPLFCFSSETLRFFQTVGSGFSFWESLTSHQISLEQCFSSFQVQMYHLEIF